MEVALWAIPLIAVGVLSSSEVIPSIVSSVVPSSWCSIPIDVHRNRGVIHPARGVRRVVLRRVLSLRTSIVPLGTLLLRSKCSEVSISSKYVLE